MSRLWLTEFSWPVPEAVASKPGATLWQAADGLTGRAYLPSHVAPGVGWTALDPLQSIEGASAGATSAAFHYVVETDVAPEHERELNAWYEQEHLPGLARVPGTIRAARYRRGSGSPLYVACYDLTSPQTLEHPQWLAVRHTQWSSEVRPMFQNTRRMMFKQPATGV